MGNFKDLRVWEDSLKLVKSIYRSTSKDSFSKDYGLKDQIRRSAVSIASNIAEGEGRGSNRDGIRFLHIAKSSTAEFITQLIIAESIGYIDKETCESFENHAERINASIKNLINAKTQLK